MAIDIGREIRNAIKTGKVLWGTEQTEKALQKGNVKLMIVTSNPPLNLKRVIDSYSDIPVYRFNGNNFDLGSTCGKPFAISVLSILDPGNSNILKLTEE